ncbi:MAG: aminopeptidase N, partial [Candidatus Paceibacteria bacterium]
DVLAYDLELAVRPSKEILEGVATITITDLAPELETLRIDLYDFYEVLDVRLAGGEKLAFSRNKGENWLDISGLTSESQQPLAVRIHYRGQPKGGRFDGFHWETTEDGAPWINTACQGLGAHYWYPCKASYFHPADKPERISMAITCPAKLMAVSNGRLVEEKRGAPDWFKTKGKSFKTYFWRHDYPLETYAVTLNVAPYVHVEQQLEVPGLEKKLPFHYYVLPENAEKAALQFQQVPELLRIYSEAFGPYPFPDSKFALVETNFWGMEHSTAVAYGSSYPAWCKANGKKDRYAGRNRWFDYILIHEVAHEWWGNAVSAEHWGHFWIHEGLGTYAEGVYVEKTRDREAADRFFKEKGARIPGEKGMLYRGDHPESGDAYSGLVYSKGSCVMHTLRHYVDDDAAWWKTLADFNLAFRYKNATTEDFQAVLEDTTGREWKQFFDEWIYGEGTPAVTGSVSAKGKQILIELSNERGSFHLPLDLVWTESGEEREQRVWIAPGTHSATIECSAKPKGVRVAHLDRLLGSHLIQTPDE